VSSLLARSVAALAVASALVFGGLPESRAQEEKEASKYRVGFFLGGTRTEAEIESEAGHTLFLEDVFREPVDFLRDPRNDTGALGSLDFGYGVRAAVSGGYQFSDRWSVELSGGYQRSDVGNIEMQVQFDGLPRDDQFQFQFDIFGVPAGTVEQVPLDLSFQARFRPKAAVRPYVGFGFGYMWVGFDPSDELNQLSSLMDSSSGFDTRIEGDPFGRKDLAGVAGTERSLQGAAVEAPDTWTWHLSTGLEWAFKRKWSLITDVRYVGANKNFRIGFDGGNSLGRSVPDGIQTLPTDRPPDSYPYGAVQIFEGGLVDAGGLYVLEANQSGQLVYTPCDVAGIEGCQFYRIPDGTLDQGLYYVQGGEIRYSYLGVQVGLKYTF
jgi:opacity protein-like surface antigen